MELKDLKIIKIKHLHRDWLFIILTGDMEVYGNIEPFTCNVFEWHNRWLINSVSFNLDSERRIFETKFLEELKFSLEKNKPKLKEEIYLILKSLI